MKIRFHYFNGALPRFFDYEPNWYGGQLTEIRVWRFAVTFDRRRQG
jgi:hypothetical protein